MASGVGTPSNSNTAGPVIIFLLGMVLILFAFIEKCGVSRVGRCLTLLLKKALLQVAKASLS